MSDLISRQAAIDALFELYEYQRDIDPTEAADLVRQGIFLAEKKIEKLPPAQPEWKRGRWIYGEDNLGTGRDGWFCSECGHFELWDYSADMKSAELNLPNYCPNCGADMRGEQDE